MQYLLQAEGMNEIFFHVCSELMSNCDNELEVRGLHIKEIIDAKIVLTNPYNRFISLPERNMDMRYFIGELCFYFAGSDELSFINYYSKFWNKISDDYIRVRSCYGKRLFFDQTAEVKGFNYPLSQFDYAFHTLIKDEHTRKAIMLISNYSDSRESKDNPCTMYLHFFIRRSKLYLIVYVRSNDIWFGLTYDIPFFTIMQEIMFNKLKLRYPQLQMGTYTHSVGSLHLYMKDYGKAETLINKLHPLSKGDIEKVLAPTLCSIDIEQWFKNLLSYEELKRRDLQGQPSGLETHFQRWCKNLL